MNDLSIEIKVSFKLPGSWQTEVLQEIEYNPNNLAMHSYIPTDAAIAIIQRMNEIRAIIEDVAKTNEDWVESFKEKLR